MGNPYTRQKIENWVSDFDASDALRRLPTGVQEYAASILLPFMLGACEPRDVEPEELEEVDIKAAMEKIARLDVPESIKSEVPNLCAEFLSYLHAEGRLAGGSMLAAYARAMRVAYGDAAAAKVKPIVNAGSKIGRNDPCPCGSGKKYKKCCGG